jgi:hypothetical protein
MAHADGIEEPMSTASSTLQEARKRRRPLTRPVALALLAIAVSAPTANGDVGIRPTSASHQLTQCPCNVGLPGGPTVAATLEASSRTSTSSPTSLTLPSNGFDWTDAGVGAAATLGIILLLGGLAAAVRTARGGREPAGTA